MKLGANLIYSGAVELAQKAERLGYSICLAPEGFRSDAVSVLGVVAGRTEKINIGSAVMQIPARTPAITALTASTLSSLSGGRFRLGIGVSNPEVSTGWYNASFADPIARTREYIEIIRLAMSGDPTTYDGTYYKLPETSTPMRITTTPTASGVPIYLAAVGPRNLALAGEAADGWIGVFCEPSDVKRSVQTISASRGEKEMHGFEILPCLASAIGADEQRCIDSLRTHYALMMGVGAFDSNFYCKLAKAKGYGEQALTVNHLVRVRDVAAAAAAVPSQFIQDTALVGSIARVADRMAEYADAGVTTLSIMTSALHSDLEGRLKLLEDAAHALDRSGVHG
jgi:F420-dependent oxidoreductase-like protein